MRSLSPDEELLWGRVTASIRPLSRDRNEAQPTELPEQSIAPMRPFQAPPKRPVARPAPRIANTLDKSWDRRLSSGAVEADRVLDLHGLTLDSAWQAIDRGLEQAIARGDRVVLLITGHHRPGDPPIKRGKIRAAVHDWLAASRHAGSIAAVRGAHRRHGGGGSLYLVLRRPR
ncbi:MAG TPA: Smr/MutS family protein [Sphingomicrobium sp.]|nr:Smr/MutS family protein [Sphingomicrobium sp.]